jgi:hypothetical protein
MTIEIRKVRPPVISQLTYEHLNSYRGFRHIVRNVYTFNLSIAKLQVLIDGLKIAHSGFREDIDNFCCFIAE